MIPPKNPWHRFESDEEKLAYLKEIKLIPKSLGLRPIYYAGGYTDEPVVCDVLGYMGARTVVISVGGELHCIHPDLLIDMQPKRQKKQKVSCQETMPIEGAL